MDIKKGKLILNMRIKTQLIAINCVWQPEETVRGGSDWTGESFSQSGAPTDHSPTSVAHVTNQRTISLLLQFSVDKVILMTWGKTDTKRALANLTV